MKAKDLFDAIGEINDDVIRDAKEPVRPTKRGWLISAVAAVLALSILACAIMIPNFLKNGAAGSDLPGETTADEPKEPSTVPPVLSPLERFALMRAVYPTGSTTGTTVPQGMSTSFFTQSIFEFLSNTEGKNALYSPLNAYMALAMLAETANGESRAQILELMDVDSIETLREQAKAVWTAHYRTEEKTRILLGSSIWLQSDVVAVRDTLEILAQNYYASVFRGEMGSDAYDEAFRSWLNEQTGDLLEDAVEGISLDANTVVALATTVLFEAQWNNRLYQTTQPMTFHGTDGDTTCGFLHDQDRQTYYEGEQFSAVRRGFSGAGSMYFLLPEEGVTPEALLSDPQVMSFLLGEESGVSSRTADVKFFVPQFDISSTLDLSDGLQRMGVTDVLDPNQADFSSLTDGIIWAEKVLQSTRLTIDEYGCRAAAFTIIPAPGSTPPDDEQPIDFVLDRPFLFVLRSNAGMPLFVGIVNQA